MLLETPQDRSVKTEYQKRKCEDKSLENTDREKSKVYTEKNEVERKKNGNECLCLQTH